MWPWDRAAAVTVGMGKQIGTLAGSGIMALTRHRSNKDGRYWARDADDIPTDEGPAAADIDGVIVAANGAYDEGASDWSERVRLSEALLAGAVGSSCARESVVDACRFFRVSGCR